MESKEITLDLQINLADSYWKRLKGLLFYKKPLRKGLLITPCNSVHMFFMRFPIDVVFLDQTDHVVKVVPHLKPWRMVLPVQDAHAALELPVGMIHQHEIQAGDRIAFKK